MANLIDKSTVEKEFFESQFISQNNKDNDTKLFNDASEASSFLNKQKQTAQYRIIKKDFLNEQNISDSTKNEKIVSYKTLSLNNATKITGKLVAFRKDGLSYTLKPITTTSSQNFVTSKTLTYSFSDQKALKNSPQLNNTFNGKNSDQPKNIIVNNSQKLICKTLNTSTQNKDVIKPSEIKLFTPKDNSNQKLNQTALIKQTNSIKPIILHMKRKIQVPKNENYKTAKIFTLPSNKLIGNNKIISNQNQISSQFIIMDKQSSLKTLNCFSNEDNKIILNKKTFVPVTSSTNTGTFLKSVKSFTSLNSKIIDQESINKLPVKLEKKLSLLIPSKQSETLVSKNFVSYAEKDESLKNNCSDSEINNFSENNKLKINENYNETELNYEKKNSSNENQKIYSVENLVFTSTNEQMSIENNNVNFDENQNFYNDCGSHCEIKNEFDTFSDKKLKENFCSDEKYFDNINYSETYESTKSDTPLILNENSSTLQNMQTEIKTDLFNNLIMDECAAAMVLMSLSYSPKNNSSLLQNHASTSSSLISQKVVFQCTWRNCGKESEDRQEIKQHIRQEHLKVRKPKGNHEEDFYYTEIDVFDSNTQDSSGISSAADSPQQSIASCCGELVECCNCNEIEFENKKIDTKSNFNENELNKNFSIKIFNKNIKKECKISCINKKQIQRKIIDKNRKVKKNSNLWSKKKFEVKHNRVGRPKRIKINSQFLSVKKNIEKEKNALDCGKLEWSVRRNASSPINIPGISLAHHQTKNNKNFDYKKINENLDLIDVNYNSDQFNVGSVRSSCVELLEQCMGKHERENNFNERKSSYSSSNSSGLPASLNSFGTSIYSTNSSTSSSPPLHSDYSTTDQDFNEEWIFDKNSKQKNTDNIETFDYKETKNICKNLDLPDKNSIKKYPNIIKLRLPSEQENSKPYLVRNSRQNVNSNQQTNKINQKTNGYYADLHRGLIQPPNLHHFSNSDFFNNSLQSSNHQIDKTTSNTSSSKNIQTKTTTQIARRSRNGSGNGGKCRKKYGMENRDQWCVQCRWKKACSRVEPAFSIDDNEFSTNSTLINGVVQSYMNSEQVTLH